MPEKYVRLLGAYYCSTQAHVRADGEKFMDFPLDSGVRQGCSLALILFNHAIDWIMRRVLNNFRGIQHGQDYWVTDLEFEFRYLVSTIQSNG